MNVKSLVGDDNRLREDHLLHQDGNGWTFLRRYEATIDDVRIKGVGTFAFDSIFKWKLKKTVKPAWSELPIELHVQGEEDALTPSRLAFVKQVIGNAAFKPTFETYVFKLYTEIMYPDFEAMSDDNKAEWFDCYPKVAAPGEIWKLIGKKRSLHVNSDNEFHLAADACWDPEHGLTVDVKDWQIER